MKQKTKNKLYAAWAWCDHEDKSTEFMLQFMADEAGVEYDTAVDFVTASTDEARTQWYKDNPDWLNKWRLEHILCPAPKCPGALLEPMDESYTSFKCPKCGHTVVVFKKEYFN